jgi:hypothetical protein
VVRVLVHTFSRDMRFFPAVNIHIVDFWVVIPSDRWVRRFQRNQEMNAVRYVPSKLCYEFTRTRGAISLKISVLFVCCLIVVPLPPGENPFAVNNNNNNLNTFG